MKDILVSKDPWRGADCGRANCLLWSTKILTGKETYKDCTKRNILYELRCLSCEEEEIKRIEELTEDDDERKELKRKMNVPKYIGDSSQSANERGYKHLDRLASLSSNSPP